MASSVGSRLSRDDFRKAKELEELRKTGAAPPELDDEGKMINPHIPQYMSQAPWYYNTTKPGLKHQYHSKFKSSQQLGDEPQIATFQSSAKSLISKEPNRSTYVEGACENCGSLTHTVKQCLERPRKKTAKYGGEVIGRDEILIEKKLDYDGKRDRWNGYDPREYKKVVEMHEKAEIERKKKKLEELEAQFRADQEKQKTITEQKDKQEEQIDNTADHHNTTNTTTQTIASSSSSSSSVIVDPKESDLDKLKRLRQQKKLDKLRKKLAAATTAKTGDSNANTINGDTSAAAAPPTDTDSDTDSDIGSDDDVKDYGEVITKMDAKSRTTVRNLRIREDTAKYLRNLAEDSAYYDPKTRSMRETPYPDKRPDEVLYAGDNFVRASGEVKEIAKLQKYVWEQNEKQALRAELGLPITTDTDSKVKEEDPVMSDIPTNDVHAVALPSAAEKLYSSYKAKRELAAAHNKHEILSRYGGEEHLIRPSADLLMNVQEEYVEYDEHGQVIKGREREMRKSKYLEDQYEDGHTEVWGSWMSDFKWGYDCCHETIRHCVCLGEAGKKVKEEMEKEMKHREAMPGTQAAAIMKNEAAKQDGRKEKRPRDDESHHTSEPLFRNKQGYNRGSDGTAAPPSSSVVPTDVELDSYHRNRSHNDDPMHNFTGEVV